MRGIVLDLWRNAPFVLCSCKEEGISRTLRLCSKSQSVLSLERGYRTKLVLFALVASHLQEEKSILRVYFSLSAACLLAALTVFPHSSRAQESPYIVTYDHYLEEPGSLEVEYFSTFGTQRAGNDFHPLCPYSEHGTIAGS